MKATQLFCEAITSNWENCFKKDEWFFSRLEDKIASQLSSHESFLEIDEVVTILLHQTEPLLQRQCGSLLMVLARKSNTTEIPPKLRDNYNSVIETLKVAPDILEQFKGWYRI